MALHSIIVFMLFLYCIPTTSIATDNQTPRKISEDGHICVISDTKLEKLLEYARVKSEDPQTDDPIIVFDGNIPTTEQILGLIPTCKIKQTLFNVTANYDPNILPEEQAGKVQTKIEGSDETVQVTSCHQLFENTVTTKACKAEAEKLSCKRIDGNLNCTTSFVLNCDLTGYAFEIQSRPGVSVVVDAFKVNGPTPCNFKFETTRGFRLLMPNQSKYRRAGEYKSFGLCYKSMLKIVEELCGVQTTTPATMTIDGTGGEATTIGTEAKTTKKTIAECILKVPYLLLICGAILQLIIVIVLTVVLIVCKRRSAVEANEQPKEGSPIGPEQLHPAEEDNLNDPQQFNNNDTSWRKEKSEWMGVPEPNIKDEPTVYSGDYDLISSDLISDEYNIEEQGIDVPPTREEDFFDDE